MNFLQRLFGKGPRKPKLPKVDIHKRFDLIVRLGPGSMSKVWKARDRKTGMLVALKILDKRKTEQFEARFRGLNKPTEGEIAVQLRHPNIVRTYEYGLTRQGEPFLVMELIEGVSLEFLVEVQNEQMKRHRLDYMIQLGEAVAYLHRSGWIHRDICPRNVLVDKDNVLKIIDFGLVVPNTEPFRRPGNRTGTANYMAPELIKRQWTDHRIDIFSYAVTCYEMCSGKLPWEAVQSLEMVLRRINQPPRDIRELVPGIDDELADVIMRGLAADPNQRWQSAEEMTTRFRAIQERLRMQGGPPSQKTAPEKTRPDGPSPALERRRLPPSSTGTSSAVSDKPARQPPAKKGSSKRPPSRRTPRGPEAPAAPADSPKKAAPPASEQSSKRRSEQTPPATDTSVQKSPQPDSRSDEQTEGDN